MHMRTISKPVALMAILSVGLCLEATEVITVENFQEVEQRYNAEWTYPNGAVASNVYALVRNIYGGHRSPFDHFLTVRGGGVSSEMDISEIMPLVNFVSNHCAAIATDWPTYETNEMVRFTTLCAVGFAGYDNYTNFSDTVLALYEANTNNCSWDTIKFIHAPYGTASENSLSLNYDQPVVSNLLLRIRARAIEVGDPDRPDICEDQLSGAAKLDCLDMQSWGQP